VWVTGRAFQGSFFYIELGFPPLKHGTIQKDRVLIYDFFAFCKEALPCEIAEKNPMSEEAKS